MSLRTRTRRELVAGAAEDAADESIIDEPDELEAPDGFGATLPAALPPRRLLVSAGVSAPDDPAPEVPAPDVPAPDVPVVPVPDVLDAPSESGDVVVVDGEVVVDGDVVPDGEVGEDGEVVVLGVAPGARALSLGGCVLGSAGLVGDVVGCPGCVVAGVEVGLVGLDGVPGVGVTCAAATPLLSASAMPATRV